MTIEPYDVRVSRELLERIAAWLERANQNSDEDIDECVQLRALLAQPADQHAPFPGYPPVPDDRKLPADQQGEPVVFVDASELRNLTVSGFDSFSALLHREQASIVCPQRVPLYRPAQPATAKVDEHKLNIVVNKVDDICEKFEMEGLHSHPTYKQFKRLHAELARAKLNGGQS